MVERAVETFLEKAESILNRIGVRLAHGVGSLVNDGLMFAREFALEREYVYRVFVAVDRANLLADMLL
jgi:hypothetical protein